MNEVRSLREYDSLPDRIRHSRQADPRPVLILEGPSDEALLQRLMGSRWALYIAGTRDAVATAVEGTEALGVTGLAGLIDRDFDDLATQRQQQGLAIFTFDEADLEAALVTGPWFDDLVTELASADKLSARGGVDALRSAALAFAVKVGAARRSSREKGWDIDFKGMKLIERLDSQTLTLKVDGFCSVAARCCTGALDSAELRGLLHAAGQDPPFEPGLFRGKDALLVVQLALKRLYGNLRIDDERVLPAALRLTASADLMQLPPFPALEAHLAA